MDDPLLSSLCTICHIDRPKYTCPRCAVQTCSLRCSKRHKLWASCNGIRDPTAFMPMSKLATPSGIDHDYNFLHSIETRIQRSEKVLIEDLGIISNAELKRARAGEDEEMWKQSHREPETSGEVQIARALKAHNIKIMKAPKGMRRNRENTTSWNKKHRQVNWQVEWVREPPLGRTLYRALGNKPIGDVYDILCDEERRMNMTGAEKTAMRKRKAAETKERNTKKAKLDKEAMDLSNTPNLQNPETTAWDVSPDQTGFDEDMQEGTTPPAPKERNYNLYLLRPSTPASFPKVLKHIDPDKTLTELLWNRKVLEFPTIYVLENKPEELPNAFMSEKAFLAATGEAETDTDMSSSDEETEDSDETSSDSSSSSSDEDGEIIG